MKFDGAQEAAIAGTSWGGWQILGENWQELGYNSALDFYESMFSPRGQLDAFVRYIVVNKLDDELRERRWEDFARRYNGPNYKKNQYAWKLAREYQRIIGRDAPKKPIIQSKTAQSTAAITVSATGAAVTAVSNTSSNGAVSSIISALSMTEWLLIANAALTAIFGTLILIRYRRDSGHE